jgi:hypothetical protein
MAQGGHALAQYALEHPALFREWGNQTIVYLGVRNLIDLRAWDERLKRSGKEYSLFREPDLDGHETALACFDSGEIFSKLHLA